MILRSSCLRYYMVITVICCLALSACCLPLTAADAPNSGAEGLITDPDAIIRKILGVDDMAKNVCLIDSHQMVNTADLPGRLIAISADKKVPSDLLRYSFRKAGTKTTTQVNPPTDPIQLTRLESSQAKSGSFLSWFGASMAKEDIAELRTVPMPATSISVDDLDESAITARFNAVPEDVRKGLGIITDVIPYEVWASVCKKVTTKAQSGIWYIQLGRDTYCKQSDELRKYYLVAVYTPLVFYADIGVIPATKSASTSIESWLPGQPVNNRSEALRLWLKEQTGIPSPGSFSTERQIGWGDTSEQILPKPQGNDQGDSVHITTQQDNGSSPSITTVMPQ